MARRNRKPIRQRPSRTIDLNKRDRQKRMDRLRAIGGPVYVAGRVPSPPSGG